MATELADAVLPLIRTRADLHWRSRASDHGTLMHYAVDLLASALQTEDPADVHSVTTRAIASAMLVIARADDSDGIIGDACHRLLKLHPVTAAAGGAGEGRRGDRSHSRAGPEGRGLVRGCGEGSGGNRRDRPGDRLAAARRRAHPGAPRAQGC